MRYSLKHVGASRKLRVAIGAESTAYGGLEKMLSEEYRLCRQQDFDPSLIVSTKVLREKFEHQLNDINPSIIRYTPPAFPDFGFYSLPSVLKLRLESKFIKGFQQFDGFSIGLSGYKFGPALLDLASDLNKPALATIHGYLPYLTTRDNSMKAKYRKAFKCLRGLSAVSEDALKAYLLIFEEVLPLHLRLEVIENFVDDDFFKIGQERMQKQQPFNLKRHKRIVAAGRLVQSKRFDDVIKVFKLVSSQDPGVLLTIAGTGDKLSDLRNLAKRLSLEHRIDFAGHINLKDFLKDADLFLTATEREGGASLAAAEALAAGLPVYGFKSPGLREALDPCSAAHLVANRNVQELAEAILSFLRSPQSDFEVNHHAYDFARKRFSKERWTTQRLNFQNLIR